MMSSPFPGMDPYTEVSPYFQTVHHMMLASFLTQLNRGLPDDFIANIEERVYIVDSGTQYQPDAIVFQTASNVTQKPAPYSDGSVMVLTTEKVADVPIIVESSGVESSGTEIRERFIEIRKLSDQERVITSIEILSPINKMQGAGYEAYRQKQSDTLNSDTNLLEIDLLRAGQHTVATPFTDLRHKIGYWDYLVCLHRAAYNRFDCWHFTVRDRFPRVWVPLIADYDDILLDLQPGFTTAYESGSFHKQIDYSAEPYPAYSRAADREWADALLREKGLRPTGEK